MNVEYRKAKIEDLNVIQNLNNELFKLEKENYDPTLVNDWPITEEGKEYFIDLINNHFVWVAVIDNEIVGYLAGTIEEKGSYELVQYGEVNNMIITEKCRGLGVGRSLMDSFKKYCKDNGINNLKVVASAKNANAIAFYRKNGFKDFNLTLTMEV